MKHLEEMAEGEVVHEIGAADLLMSTGICLAKWASDITFTDAAYAEGWIAQTAEIMATHSEMLYLLFTQHHALLRDISIVCPPDIQGIVTVNPFRKNSMSGKEESDDPSKPTETGGSDSLSDIPF